MSKFEQTFIAPSGRAHRSVADDVTKRGERVKFMRKKLLGLSRADFCRDFTYSPQSLKAWELGWGGGLAEERAKELVQHLKSFGISTTVPWIMYGIGMAPTPLKGGIEISEEEEEHLAKDILSFRKIINSVDTVVKDDSMVPIFYPNDYVGGILIDNPLQAIGRECIITDTTGNTYVRTLKKGDQANFYDLVCYSTSSGSKRVLKNIAIQTVAPIVLVRRRIPRPL